MKCHDCGVEVGELHIPGCDTEQCPSCGGQAISCGCSQKKFKSAPRIKWSGELPTFNRRIEGYGWDKATASWVYYGKESAGRGDGSDYANRKRFA